MAAEGFHEAPQELTPFSRDLHRAIRSLMEELEAVDWYQQRVDAAQDPDLKAILAHNRDEEKEHAAMLMEWLRRQDTVLDEQLRKYLFSTVPIVGQEKSTNQAEEASSSSAVSSVGSLKGAGR